MTTTETEARPLRPDELFHVLSERGALIAGGAYRRGDTLSLTAQQIEGQRGRDGKSWTDDLSEAAQIARWGACRFGLGPWPGGPTWIYGSAEWELAREEARRAAWAIPNPQERVAALQRVTETFGKGRTTSHAVGGPTDPQLVKQAAEARAQRLAETPKPRPRDLDRELALADLMEVGKAAAFDRELERQELLSERGQA